MARLEISGRGLSDCNAPVVFPPSDWDTETVHALWKHIHAFDIAILKKIPERVGDLPNTCALRGAGPKTFWRAPRNWRSTEHRSISAAKIFRRKRPPQADSVTPPRQLRS